MPPAEGGETVNSGSYHTGSRRYLMVVTLNYGVGNGGFISNMSLVFNSGLGGSITIPAALTTAAGWAGIT